MSWLSNLFGGNKKQDTSYGGQRPVTSLREVQGGQPYYDTISKRLNGEGVGYGEQYASQASNPVIARMRNQFNSYDMPELKSELSAQGRRKGSGGFDQIRRAYQEQGLNEGDVFSQLYQQNENQKRNEVNDALGRMGEYASNEANLMGQRAAFDTADHTKQLGIASSQRTEGNAAMQRLIGAGVMMIPGGQFAGSSMMGTQTPSYQSQYSPSQYDQIMKAPSSPYVSRLKVK